jgi:predicted Zn-dependent peptidase
MGHMESAAIGVWLNVGSRYEDKRVSGISHFIEHMVFKGTTKRSGQRIKEEIEGRGGSLNGFTSEEMTCYLAKVNGLHINIALDVLSDMVLNANLKPLDIEHERAVIIEEIKMYHDLPNHHVHDMLHEVMWGAHPLGEPVVGRIESISSITRQNLMDYKKANYIPQNIAVVLCGNLNGSSQLSEKIKKIFYRSKKAYRIPFVNFTSIHRGPTVKILAKKTEQSHLCMGMHTFGRMHKDRYILNILHIILGGNMSSRLFENVREKRALAYEIGTEIRRYKETGAFVVNAGIEHDKVKEAVRVIIRELKKIKDKTVSKDEIERAKEFFKVQLSLALEDTLDHMLWLGEQVITTSKIITKEDMIKDIDTISQEDIQKVAKAVFKSSNLNIALISPIKDKDKREIDQELHQL